MSIQLPLDENVEADHIDHVDARHGNAGPLLTPVGSSCDEATLPDSGEVVVVECHAVRAAFYVDGFNLYHAIDNLKRPYLKWIDLWALCERLIPKASQRLDRVVYCSAKKSGDIGKMQRHQELINAFEHCGVVVKLGHFSSRIAETCRECNNRWYPPKEKESDTNLALSVIGDAHADLYDHAYLMTADSDQGPTAEYIRRVFPNKTFTSVVLPGQQHSRSIVKHATHQLKVTEINLERSLLRKVLVEEVEGRSRLIYRRPPAYDPPSGWVAPDKRPHSRTA